MLDHHRVVITYKLSKVGDRKLIPQITNTQNYGLTQSVRLAGLPQMRQIADYSLQPNIFCNLRIFPIFCRLIQLPQIFYYIIFLLTNTVYPVGFVIDNKKILICKKKFLRQLCGFSDFLLADCDFGKISRFSIFG